MPLSQNLQLYLLGLFLSQINTDITLMHTEFNVPLESAKTFLQETLSLIMEDAWSIPTGQTFSPEQEQALGNVVTNVMQKTDELIAKVSQGKAAGLAL